MTPDTEGTNYPKQEQLCWLLIETWCEQEAEEQEQWSKT